MAVFKNIQRSVIKLKQARIVRDSYVDMSFYSCVVQFMEENFVEEEMKIMKGAQVPHQLKNLLMLSTLNEFNDYIEQVVNLGNNDNVSEEVKAVLVYECLIFILMIGKAVRLIEASAESAILLSQMGFTSTVLNQYQFINSTVSGGLDAEIKRVSGSDTLKADIQFFRNPCKRLLSMEGDLYKLDEE